VKKWNRTYAWVVIVYIRNGDEIMVNTKKFLVCILTFVLIIGGTPIFSSASEEENTSFKAIDIIEEYADSLSNWDLERYISLFSDEQQSEMNSFSERNSISEFFGNQNIRMHIKKYRNITKYQKDLPESDSSEETSLFYVLFDVYNVDSDQHTEQVKLFELENEVDHNIVNIFTPDSDTMID
jgi:hypothetical protein